MIFGADYYPEQWKETDWDEDIKLMKDMGLRAVRLAEFSWALMEPKEGKYTFTFWKKVLDKFLSAEMSVILGTPTATFPPWLYKKYPDIIQTRGGVERIIGTRRQACLSSTNYRNASQKIVEKMSEALGKHPAVIGWQIDNELGHEGSDIDESDNSLKGFRIWLKKKYGTIKKLNEVWGSAFWGIAYNDFNEIPIPGPHIGSGFNPSMVQDFYRFHSDTAVEFVDMQAKILRKNSPGRKLTTNLYPSPFLPVIDMHRLSECLDYVSWDNYPTWGDQEEPFPHPFIGAMQEYTRGLKNKPHTVMEQISGFQGHDVLGYLPAPGQIGLWLAHSVAHGADQVFFFRFRTALYGQEQLCYGILNHSKQITDRYLELQSTIKKLNKNVEDFASEDFPAEVAVLHDIENARNWKQQAVSKGLKFSPVPYAQLGYDVEMATWYSGFNLLNVNTHFRPFKSTNLNQYKVIALPMYAVTDPAEVERLEEYVKHGGILILGYRSGWKDQNIWMLDSDVPGPFQELAGVKVRKFEAVGEQQVKFRFRLFPSSCSKICEILEPTTAEVIAKYRDKRKFYKGKPVITRNRYFAGKVYYVGASLSPLGFLLLYRRILRDAKIPFHFRGKEVEVVQRKGKKHNYRIVLNHSKKPKWVGWRRIPAFGFQIIKERKSAD